MAASSADDHLTVGGDADVVVIESRCDAAGPSLSDPDHRIVDRRTQISVHATLRVRRSTSDWSAALTEVEGPVETHFGPSRCRGAL